jgi:hypothetical protein
MTKRRHHFPELRLKAAAFVSGVAMRGAFDV